MLLQSALMEQEVKGRNMIYCSIIVCCTGFREVNAVVPDITSGFYNWQDFIVAVKSCLNLHQ